MTRAAAGGGGIDRREFLRSAALSAGALAILPLLESCSSGSSNGPPVPQAFRELARSLHSKPGLQVFPGAGDLIAGTQQRFPFGMADQSGATVLADGRLWIGQGRALTGPYAAVSERYSRVAEPGDPHGFSVTNVSMPREGTAWVMAEAQGLYGFSALDVLPAPQARAVGQEAISVATPTVGHPRGVKNICTRKPPCPMHKVSLDEALRAHEPVVFTIASPLLCTSRTCGPVLDEILIVKEGVGDVLFVHAEPYKGDTATTLSPTAEAWNIPSEPWVWIIDDTGVVSARFEGPVVALEVTGALAAVL